jgi:capsid protein
MVEPFERAMLRGVAASLGTEYFTLTSDLTQVNFSAGRLGVDEERDAWRVIQGWKKEHIIRPVFLDWLQSGMLEGILPIGPGELARLSEPKITARGYGYYDPLKDVEATVMAIDNGLDTRTDTLAEQGKDFDEVLETLKDEKEAADAAGIIFVGGKPSPGIAPENKPADPNDPNAG